MVREGVGAIAGLKVNSSPNPPLLQGPNIITNEERVALKEMYNDRYSHGGYYLYEADAEEALALAEMEAADNYAHGGYYIHEAVEKEASEEVSLSCTGAAYAC